MSAPPAPPVPEQPASRWYHVKVLYTLNSNPQYILGRHLALIGIPIPAINDEDEDDEVVEVDPKGKKKAKTRNRGYAKVPLKACLGSVCVSSPELIADRRRDYSVYALDPLQVTPTPLSISTEGQPPQPQGVMAGMGLMSWMLAEPDGIPFPAMVIGKVVRDPYHGEALEVILTLQETKSMTPAQHQESVNSWSQFHRPNWQKTLSLPPPEPVAAPPPPTVRPERPPFYARPAKAPPARTHAGTNPSRRKTSPVRSSSPPTRPSSPPPRFLKDLFTRSDLRASSSKPPSEATPEPPAKAAASSPGQQEKQQQLTQILSQLAQVDSSDAGKRPQEEALSALAGFLLGLAPSNSGSTTAPSSEPSTTPAPQVPERPHPSSPTRPPRSSALTRAPLRPQQQPRAESSDDVVVVDKENVRPPLSSKNDAGCSSGGSGKAVKKRVASGSGGSKTKKTKIDAPAARKDGPSSSSTILNPPSTPRRRVAQSTAKSPLVPKTPGRSSHSATAVFGSAFLVSPAFSTSSLFTPPPNANQSTTISSPGLVALFSPTPTRRRVVTPPSRTPGAFLEVPGGQGLRRSWSGLPPSSPPPPTSPERPSASQSTTEDDSANSTPVPELPPSGLEEIDNEELELAREMEAELARSNEEEATALNDARPSSDAGSSSDTGFDFTSDTLASDDAGSPDIQLDLDALLGLLNSVNNSDASSMTTPSFDPFPSSDAPIAGMDDDLKALFGGCLV